MKAFSENNLNTIGKDIARWLICGKGPSIKYYDDHKEGYTSIAINQAVETSQFDFWHVIDIDIFENYDLSILNNFNYLVMPWIPHVAKNRYFYKGINYYAPGKKNLDDLLSSNKIIRTLNDQGRLYAYSFLPDINNKILPNIDRAVNSSGVIYNLLKNIKAKEIRTIGIDGGTKYANYFKKYENKKLTTSHQNYDDQFQDISKTIFKTDILSGPINMNLPLNIYVGCEPEQEIAFDVLNYSITKHTSISVNVLKLHEEVSAKNLDFTNIIDQKNTGKTPFSFQRFCIPKLNNYHHNAIYLDSDMLVFKDILNLCNNDIDTKEFLACEVDSAWGRSPQLSVMYINCNIARWDVNNIIKLLNDNKYSYSDIFENVIFSNNWDRSIPCNWNSLEHHDESTSLIHFTDMDTQPWINAFHSQTHIWVSYLIEAINNGFCSIEKVQKEIDIGNIRPSLKYQIKNNLCDPNEIPYRVLMKDNINYFPIHRRGSSSLIKFKYSIKRYILTIQKIFLSIYLISYKKLRSFFGKMLDFISHEK